MAAGSPERRRPLVELAGIEKRYGNGPLVLDGIDIKIANNEFFTLLGPSGCGKTTLLRLMAGFEQPTAGAVLLDDRDVSADPPNRRPVNTVFQSYALFPHLTVLDNVMFGLARLGMKRKPAQARAREMLSLVRLAELADRRPAQLSGGQQQRVALARALAPKPRLLLLDEPLSALDLKLRKGMQVELKRLQRETGITFVLVTHDQEEAMSMSDRIAVMDGGRVLQLGTPVEIYESPATRFVADFIGEANILPGALFGLDAALVAVRPERIGLDADPARPGGLAGRVVETVYLGAETSCEVAIGGDLSLKVALRGRLPGLEPGTAVACIVPADALLPLRE